MGDPSPVPWGPQVLQGDKGGQGGTSYLERGLGETLVIPRRVDKAGWGRTRLEATGMGTRADIKGFGVQGFRARVVDLSPQGWAHRVDLAPLGWTCGVDLAPQRWTCGVDLAPWGWAHEYIPGTPVMGT